MANSISASGGAAGTLAANGAQVYTAAADLAAARGDVFAVVTLQSPAAVNATLTLAPADDAMGLTAVPGTPVPATVASGQSPGTFIIPVPRTKRYILLRIINQSTTDSVFYGVTFVTNSGLADFAKRTGFRRVAESRKDLHPPINVPSH